ncbi:MAG TPA: LysM peptidoglycan-binding domain-containing protein [Anaerolineae bacterium]|nr:LysM peptidoglycan-binding domain-containing protein [Anaerolineae bacterium]
MKRLVWLAVIGALIVSACAPQSTGTPATDTSSGAGPTAAPPSITCGKSPDGSTIYVVQSGDTLQEIADACGSTVEAIRELNSLTGDAIGVGQTLIVKAALEPTESAAGPTPAPQEITREQVVQPQPDDWVRGPETAAVTIIEWGDFQ